MAGLTAWLTSGERQECPDGGEILGPLVYLFAAFAVIWVALLLYSLSISRRQTSLEREIEMLKAVLAEKDGQPA